MTVGEKIQFYRKNIGMSQDELGQKLLVSRQTISLWEMDKTLPTIDNLKRLTEIFGISVDSLLNENKISKEKAETPLEVYEFSYDSSDLKFISNSLFLPTFKRSIIFTSIFLVISIFFAFSDASGVAVGIAFSIFALLLISLIRGIILSKKRWKENEQHVIESLYRYEIFQNYFVAKISKNNTVTKLLRYEYSSIDKYTVFNNYLVLQIQGSIFVIRLNQITDNSIFYSIISKKSETQISEQKKSLKALSIILIVLSFSSLLFGLMLATLLAEPLMFSFPLKMWVMFLLLPIPISSIMLGIHFKKKRYGYKKNIICGIVAAILLCIFGSFSFMFSNNFSQSEDLLLKAEQDIQIDIPEYKKLYTSNAIGQGGSSCLTSEIAFEKKNIENFEKQIKNDNRWLSSVPTGLFGILPNVYYLDCEYCLVYNTTTKELNTLPNESGNYEILCIFYDSDASIMTITNEQISFISD